jgi:Galactose oxidase, central domain
VRPRRELLGEDERLSTVNIEEPVSAPARRGPWPRALAGIGVVAVIAAGLGAYLGIRVVQGAGSGSAAGQPPARTGAAMAFDAANGTIVLFGGNGRSRSLGDTWIWDGSTWTQAHPSTSPPALSGAQMTYDPVSHDLVLVGGQRLEAVPLADGVVCSSSGSSGSGSAIGSTGSIGSGSARLIPPTSVTPAHVPQSPGVHDLPVRPSGCGVSGGGNSATWLWNGNNWSKASGSTPSVSFGGWTLATDPVSGRALLFAPQPFIAQPYSPTAPGIYGPAPLPGIACPIRITPVNDAIAQPACPRFSVPNTTWSWTGHSWKALKTASNTSIAMFGRAVIDDAVSGRLASFSSSFSILQGSPAKCPTCSAGIPLPVAQPRCCTGSVSLWDGSAWRQSKSWTSGPMLSGGTFVGDPATHSDVYLASNGQTWVWDGAWTRKHPGATPATLDGSAAAFDAGAAQVVEFGGFGTTKRASGLYDQTWTWDGSNWNLRAGSTGPAVKIPVPSPVSVPPAIPCERVPVTTPPTKAVPQPQGFCPVAKPGALPGSSGGGASTGTSVTATGTGVTAP